MKGSGMKVLGYPKKQMSIGQKETILAYQMEQAA